MASTLGKALLGAGAAAVVPRLLFGAALGPLAIPIALAGGALTWWFARGDTDEPDEKPSPTGTVQLVGSAADVNGSIVAPGQNSQVNIGFATGRETPMTIRLRSPVPLLVRPVIDFKDGEGKRWRFEADPVQLDGLAARELTYIVPIRSTPSIFLGSVITGTLSVRDSTGTTRQLFMVTFTTY